MPQYLQNAPNVRRHHGATGPVGGDWEKEAQIAPPDAPGSPMAAYATSRDHGSPNILPLLTVRP